MRAFVWLEGEEGGRCGFWGAVESWRIGDCKAEGRSLPDAWRTNALDLSFGLFGFLDEFLVLTNFLVSPKAHAFAIISNFVESVRIGSVFQPTNANLFPQSAH